MKFRPQLKAMAWGIGLAFAGVFATGTAVYAAGWGAPAQGDSGQGVDTVLGNGLNPRGLDTTLTTDENGLGPFRAPAAHTPTGQLFGIPWTEPEEVEGKWWRGNVEFGYIWTNNDDADKLIEYRDLSKGVTINNFNFSGALSDHKYFEVFGGGVGRDDQYYSATYGRYNDYRVKVFFNETPHVFSTTARPIWSGVGTGYLALKEPLASTSSATAAAQTTNLGTVGAAYYNQIRSVVNSTADTTLELKRKKGGLRIDKTLGDKWSLYTSYSLENRNGGRTFGQTGGGFPGGTTANQASATNGVPVQVVEPIDYQTHEFAIGTGYADARNLLNLAFTTSIFTDDIKRVLWENPYVSPTTANGGLNRHVQSFTTPPSNEAYTLKADYVRALGFWSGNFSTNLSYSIQNQNDDLQPYTSATGCNNVNCTTTFQNDMSYWNSYYGPNGVQTLTQFTSELKNKVSYANVGLDLYPTDKLSLRGAIEWNAFIQDNDYLACNPSLAAAYGVTCTPGLSGTAAIYGYAVEDGNNTATVTQTSTGAGQNGAVRSLGTSYRQHSFNFGGDYQLTRTAVLTLDIERESIWRKERERDWTYENKIKLGFVERSLFGGTLRTSYEYGHRIGTEWKMDAYFESSCANYFVDYASCMATYINATTGAVSNTARPPEGGKHDLADRNKHVFIGRYNHAFTETLDAMLTARHKIEEYPDPVGIDARRDSSVSTELNWQPAVTTSVYGGVTYQRARQAQVSVSGNSAYNATTNPLGCSAALYLAGGCNATLGAVGSLYNNLTGLTLFRYETTDRNWFLNLGASHKIANVHLNGNYTFTHTISPISYIAYSGATGLPNTITVAGVGTLPTAFSYPDMRWVRHQFNLSALVPINAKLSARAQYLFDKADIQDWHYDGLSTYSNVIATKYYLDSGSQSYTAHTITVFLQYRL